MVTGGRGFTYVGLLIAVAMMGAGAAAVGQVWYTTVQRSNEKELEFVGGEFKRAIERYYEVSPGPDKRLPATLSELLQDPRYPEVVRHLRKIYPDPITGSAEWGLVKQDERIVGVYSLSEKMPLRNRARTGEDATRAKYSDWKFVAELNRTPVTVPAASAPGDARPRAGP